MMVIGSSPWNIRYDRTRTIPYSRSTQYHQAIHPSHSFQLPTINSGHYQFDINGISDSIYTEVTAVEPRIRVRLEVFAIPEAYFKSTTLKGKFCPDNHLRGQDDLVVQLKGMPPFNVEFEVKEDGNQDGKIYSIETTKRFYSLNLPVSLKPATDYTISMVSVRDAQCERSNVEPSEATTISISVGEVPTISAVQTQSSHCVGDVLDYKLTGSAPFTLVTQFSPSDRRSTTIPEKHSIQLSSHQFSRIATTPGHFSILSISDQSSLRCSSSDIVVIGPSLLDKIIHPLPSARTDQGMNIVEDISGDTEAEIRFEFVGTPPFTFTYERRRAQDRSRDSTILESHTLS